MSPDPSGDLLTHTPMRTCPHVRTQAYAHAHAHARTCACVKARALRVQNEIEAAKIKREQDAIDRRKALQKECLEVLEIQIREKAQRKQQMSQRDALVIEREQLDLKRAEEAEQRARANRASLNAEHAKHLAEQIQLQATRKTLEPFLMSKAERQMNAAILRRLPS